LTFAVNLHRNNDATREAMSQMCSLLSDDLEHCVAPLYAHAPSALSDALHTGRAQFAWVSPTLLLMSPQLATVAPLLSSVRSGVTFFHAVVFCAKSSHIETLDDLDGVRAAWVAPTSASGYLVARMTLARAGVDLAKALSDEVFCDSHGEVARRVLHGDADIGGTFAHFEQGDASRPLLRAGYQDENRFASARVIATSGPIPADMIVAHRHVPIPRRSAFAAALCRLVHDPVGAAAVRTIIGADDFSPVSHVALEELSQLMATAGSLDGL
jgi:phosphonate transport system substrate-binding protein